MRIIIVTGLSGAGKTTAIRAFEDRGLFCIDNPPVTLIPDLIKSMDSADNPVDTVVLGIDTRELSFLADYGRVALSLKEAGASPGNRVPRSARRNPDSSFLGNAAAASPGGEWIFVWPWSVRKSC